MTDGDWRGYTISSGPRRCDRCDVYGSSDVCWVCGGFAHSAARAHFSGGMMIASPPYPSDALLAP